MTGTSVASVRMWADVSFLIARLRPLSGVNIKSPFESIQIFLEPLHPIGLATKAGFLLLHFRKDMAYVVCSNRNKCDW